MGKTPRVCVIGSINMDMVTSTNKVPGQGETVLGESFTTYPGGKGANQAIAAARSGAEVTMIGAVGKDDFGQSLINRFQQEGINKEAIELISHESTGVATILLSDGDNRIIVAPGANHHVTPELIEKKKDMICANDIILMQFEIPMETIEYTTQLAAQHNIPVVINPAPFQEIPGRVSEAATFFTPNELELHAMKETVNIETMKEKIMVTKGKNGVDFTLSTGEKKTVHAYSANVKDTTGAGDTFNGAFVTEFAKEQDVEKAIAFANAAASLAVEKIGAQEGIPMREAVLERMKERNGS
ncbi:ribokinase [Gracilibacillus phocaeensis]|uniref:ribokinase n=1 Tax=Gracilibacillus phocaeensis TaxID=2042304 RepID=UPI00102F8369|nr:ribokinase [Gracilibacillus phocaeensis]